MHKIHINTLANIIMQSVKIGFVFFTDSTRKLIFFCLDLLCISAGYNIGSGVGGK